MSYARTRTDKRYHHLYLADGQRLPKLRTSVLVLYYPVNPNNQYNHHHHRGFDCNTCMPRCRLLGGCDISSRPASLLLPGRQSGTVGRFHKQMDPSVAPVNNKAGSIGDHSRHLTKKTQSRIDKRFTGKQFSKPVFLTTGMCFEEKVLQMVEDCTRSCWSDWIPEHQAQVELGQKIF